MAGALEIGRVAGHRGNRGEITVRVISGEAARWTGVRGVWVAAGSDSEGTFREVSSARAYRDRLVLKLEGIENGDQAARLKGATVRVPAEDVPGLPPGRFWIADLIGAEVRGEDGETIGTVRDVLEMGAEAGGELLEVVSATGEETLVPFVAPIVRNVDADAGRIVVRLPEGLRGLNPPTRS